MQEVGKFILRFINLPILYGIRQNYLSLLISRVISDYKNYQGISLLPTI